MDINKATSAVQNILTKTQDMQQKFGELRKDLFQRETRSKCKSTIKKNKKKIILCMNINIQQNHQQPRKKLDTRFMRIKLLYPQVHYHHSVPYIQDAFSSQSFLQTPGSLRLKMWESKVPL